MPRDFIEIFGLREHRHKPAVFLVNRTKRLPLKENDAPGNDRKTQEQKQHDFRDHSERRDKPYGTGLKHGSLPSPFSGECTAP
jgi:hypothetical protein